MTKLELLESKLEDLELKFYMAVEHCYDIDVIVQIHEDIKSIKSQINRLYAMSL